jgi:cytoskeleton protein RodZ
MSPPTELASNGGDNVVDIGVVGTGGAPAPDRRQHPGPGYWLRQARERRGWSQREAADMLNLSARFLVAMEDETFDKLPAPAFARGYLRAYAKLLNLSGDEIIRRYESVVGDDSDPYFKDLSSARRQPILDFVRAHPGFIMSTLSVLALLVLLGALWWGWGLVRQQGQVLEPALDALGGAAAGVAVDDAPAAAAQDERNTLALPPAAAGSDLVPVEVEQEAPAVPPADATGAPAAMTADASVAPVATAVPPPVGAANDRLDLTVAENCWVDVRDATGAKVYSSNAQPGVPVSLTGAAPFTVVLGNAPGARLSVNGKAVDVESNIRGRVAQLVVGP